MTEYNNNIVELFPQGEGDIESKPKKIPYDEIPTPTYDKLIAESMKLDRLSKYPCDFDFSVFGKTGEEVSFGTYAWWDYQKESAKAS